MFTDTRLAFDLDAAAGCRPAGRGPARCSGPARPLWWAAPWACWTRARTRCTGPAMLEGLPQGPAGAGRTGHRAVPACGGPRTRATELAVHTSALTSGQYSPASCWCTPRNARRIRVAIDLTGLAKTGLAYLLPG